MRLSDGYIVARLRRFQSTHPSWGATLGNRVFCHYVDISIHAPIVGCDKVARTKNPIRKISIHAPIVGCDEDVCYILNRYSNISIHAPIVGCDDDYKLSYTPDIISIHAPIVGCDLYERSMLECR